MEPNVETTSIIQELQLGDAQTAQHEIETKVEEKALRRERQRGVNL